MASNSRAGLATPPPDSSASTSFDIVSHYNRLISSDPSITPAIAAIEALIANLSASNLSTISETLTQLATSSSTLLASQSNPIPLSAGTELLQRYIVTSFQSQPQTARVSGNDFTSLRRSLIQNSKLFVTRTKSARSKIAKHALPLIRDDTTIFAYGSSRVVDSILLHAAESNRYFHVVFIASSSLSKEEDQNGSGRLDQSVERLVSLGIPVATIPFPALSHAIASLPKEQRRNIFFLLGAEAVLENGAIISNLGSHLVASVAKSNNLPAYFAAESYKFTRQFPTSFGDADLQRMGAKQNTLVFRTSVNEKKSQLEKNDPFDKSGPGYDGGQVDITPPELISELITESGMMTCEGVAEELIKLWF